MPPRICAVIVSVAVPLALLGATGCLVYTDPVNQPPELAPLTGPDRIRPFDEESEPFTTKSPDMDLTFWWAMSPTCPTDLAAAKAVTKDVAPIEIPEYVVPAMPGHGERCITVVAQDAIGAAAFRTRTFTFVDRRLSVMAMGPAPMGLAIVSRAGPSFFTATLVEDGRMVGAESVEWGVAAACPTTSPGATEAVTRQPVGGGATLELHAAKYANLGCVVAVSGQDFATVPVALGNGAPTLSVSFGDEDTNVLMSQSPTFARFAPIEARVVASDPEHDPVVLTARVTAAKPSATRTPAPPCPGSKTSFCFEVAEPGAYDLEIAGNDEGGAAAAPVRRRFFVKDAAPCLGRMSPATDAGGARIVRFDDAGPVRFVVDRVLDDADPFPAVATTRLPRGAFFWHVRAQLDAANWTYLDGETGNAIDVDVRPFRGVDAFEVRVEYRDEVDVMSPVPLVESPPTAEGPAPRTPCAADAPLCGPPSCPSRFTWTVALK